MRSRLAKVLVILLIVIGLTEGPASSEIQKIRIGFMPILPSAHEFIAVEKGWYRELGLPIEELRFSSGPPIVQAFAAGQVDVAYFGIGPALVSVAKGIKAKVVASGVTEQLAVIASNTFADLFEAQASRKAFLQFKTDQGHPLKIATFPPGSTPSVMLHYWLDQLNVDTVKDAEILAMGADRVRLAVLSQQVDATMILEPIITIIRRAQIPYRIIRYGSQILPGQPGSILFVRQNLIDERPDIVEKLVLMHLKSTKILMEERDEAAEIISRKIGREVLPIEVAREALDSKALHWVANPHAIVKGTMTYNRFQVKLGRFKKTVDPQALFDFRFYDKVISTHPEYRKY
ncbi:MAG: ABC transporter substrate-binding protein [Candidatus Methylomirabilales bacterium]